MSNGNTCIKDEQIFEMSNLERMATKGQKREYMYIPDSLRNNYNNIISWKFGGS